MGCTLLALLLVILLQAFSPTTTVSVSDNSDDFATWEFPCRRCKFYFMRVSSGRAAAPPAVAAAALPESPTSSGKKTNVGAVVGLTILLVSILAVLFIFICKGRKSRSRFPSSPRVYDLKPVVAQPPQAHELVQNPATPGLAQQGVAAKGEKREDLGKVEPKGRQNDDKVVKPNRPKDPKDDDQVPKGREDDEKVVRPKVPKGLEDDDKVVRRKVPKGREDDEKVVRPKVPKGREDDEKVVRPKVPKGREDDDKVVRPKVPKGPENDEKVGRPKVPKGREDDDKVVRPKIPNVGPAEGNKDEPRDEKKKGVARHKEKKDDLVRRKRVEVEKNENEDYGVRPNMVDKEGIRQQLLQEEERVEMKDGEEVGKKVREGKTPQEVVGELKKNSLELPKIYTYKELMKAANNFKEDNRIGGGGFGTVYRGKFNDGTVIALKCLRLQGRINDFKNEIDALGKADHCNLVKLIGYCDMDLMKILVYEFMKNGSLDRWIFYSEIDKFLNWPEMKNIIRGIARGLEYLHENCDKKILHRDLKPANIILDENKNAKLCDFGLAKLINKDQSSTSTAWAGTTGYMAPEVKKDRISDKVDVYSFGVVVLEIMFGKRCDKLVSFDEIKNVKEFKFNGLIGNLREDLREDGKEIAMFGKLAMFCLNERPEKRPVMSEVVKAIDGLEARFEARKARGK